MLGTALGGEHDLVNDEPSIAHALQMALFTCFASALAISVFTLFLGWAVIPWLALGAATSTAAALVLSRCGWIRAGILLALAGIAYAIMHAAARKGGIHSIGLAIIPVLIVVTSLLLDRLISVFFSAAMVFATVIMLAIRYYLLRAEDFSNGDLGDFFIFAVTLATAAVVGRLLSARIQEGFRQVRSLSAAALEGIMIHSQGVILDVNPQFVRLFGYETAEELIGRNGLEFVVTPESAARLRQRMQEHDAGPIEITAVRKDGLTFSAEVDSQPLQYREHAAIVVSCRDISERKRAEAERERLQTQLTQVQKMECIGRLAGGVAHDFNNLLTVINGYADMALAQVRPGDPLREPLEQILGAGGHAAVLTGQLLAFSRRQILQPRPLDLNRVAAALRPMLQRLVGEDIEVRLALSTETPVVQADPHQLEQVIMNLAVNSRDAMPKGGLLLIETSVVELDRSFAEGHPGASPGYWAVLAVSDTGVGMDEATRQQIFEPFFTTKPVGEGTGLGLSMVQGIVAQSGGYIDVCSEPDRGATFKIYLRVLAGARSEEGKCPAAAALRGDETILFVEDQAGVRDYGIAVLKEYGYRVIPAANAVEALSICERESARIHLLLTDVVMPRTSGRELAASLVKMRPGIKTLFMSGYADDVVGHYGAPDDQAHFIQKPFTPEELARKVRAVLGAPARPDRVAAEED